MFAVHHPHAGEQRDKHTNDKGLEANVKAGFGLTLVAHLITASVLVGDCRRFHRRAIFVGIARHLRSAHGYIDRFGKEAVDRRLVAEQMLHFFQTGGKASSIVRRFRSFGPGMENQTELLHLFLKDGNVMRAVVFSHGATKRLLEL